jgi:hypothetical protein
MAEKAVYLGVQVQTRNMVDRAVERAAHSERRPLDLTTSGLVRQDRYLNPLTCRNRESPAQLE